MRKFSILLTLVSCLCLSGCEEKKKVVVVDPAAEKKDGIVVDAPNAKVEVGKDGVDVNAGGVKVDVDKK
jgi:hypothetical protein